MNRFLYRISSRGRRSSWNSSIISSSRCYKGLASKQSTDEKVIDLRSDTVTRPTQGMLTSMFAAEVGDDVLKEDPTVNKLEEKCAEMFGMEKALFVASGTMGNLLCLMSHVGNRGEELIIGDQQHVYIYEQGNFMQLASIPAKVLPTESNGTLSLENIQNAIQDDSDFHLCKTKLICLENTHLLAGGVPLPLEYLKQVRHIADDRNLKVHVDGARVYNAAVALNCEVKDVLENVDSVSMCLSKGLGCPVGSVIGGSEDFIKKAMRLRKSLGGGWRQSGFLAAAGLYAFENARSTLATDHSNAYHLACGIKELNCAEVLDVDLQKVRTNIVMTRTNRTDANVVVEALRKRGVLASAMTPSRIRFVTHLDVNRSDINNALEIIQQVTKNISNKL